MALNYINQQQDKPKTSKLDTFLKYLSLTMDAGKTAASLGALGGGAKVPGTPSLNAGAPSNPMGNNYLMTPEQQFMKLRGRL